MFLNREKLWIEKIGNACRNFVEKSQEKNYFEDLSLKG
jgi:hypothetical protein